jgi:prepilin-type processing-associated H-X9-DG protein
MRRRTGLLVVFGVVAVALGLFVVWLAQGRVDQSRVYCQNHLRLLAQHSEQAGLELPPGAVAGPWVPVQSPTVPAGTVWNPSLPPDQRLSWVVPLLPLMDQKRYEVAVLAPRLNRAVAWNALPNGPVGRVRLALVVCPGNPPPEGADYEVTQYVGVGGAGPDAAALALLTQPPPLPPLAPPKAGCFRYDRATPYASITDGLSTSALFAETSTDLGPWLRGGPATIRCYLPQSPRAVLGPDGQFGGNHHLGANFAFADGSVRFLTDRTTPAVIEGLFTVAGGGTDPLPGE